MRQSISNIVKYTQRTNCQFLVALIFGGALIGGCQSHSLEEELKPALLDNSSIEVSRQLQKSISTELGVQDVRIAENAFVTKSWIVIVKQARQTIEDHNIQGRDMQQPVKFQLMKSDKNCYLVSSSNSKRWLLENVNCRYE